MSIDNINEMEFVTFAENLHSARELGYKMIATIRRLPINELTPIGVYAAIFEEGGPSALLESVLQGQHAGRYSIIGCNPCLHFMVKGGQSIAISNRATMRMDDGIIVRQDPLQHLAELLAAFTPLLSPDQPRFCGGAIGYMGFESVGLVEPTFVRPTIDRLGLPEVDLYFYDQVIVFDNDTKTICLCVLSEVSQLVHDHKADQRLFVRATERLAELEMMLVNQPMSLGTVEVADNDYPITSNRSRAEYFEMVREAKKFVATGDLFQVVVSQRFHRRFIGSSFEFYCRLRQKNPSPYMFHLQFGDGVRIVGASPEVMVDINNGGLRLKPIAGTRRRGKTSEEDNRLAAELLADPKERAEHQMLVDLGRNDVGRSAVVGSVKLTKQEVVEYYSTVMHIVSEVTGRLAEGVLPIEACLRCMPAGTLSGAPKLEACKCLGKLEGECRGPYGGAVGTFTANDIDTGILIRSAVFLGEDCHWQAGGGIVADSDPEAEYQETLAKGKAIGQLLDPNFGVAGEIPKETLEECGGEW